MGSKHIVYALCLLGALAAAACSDQDAVTNAGGGASGTAGGAGGAGGKGSAGASGKAGAATGGGDTGGGAGVAGEAGMAGVGGGTGGAACTDYTAFVHSIIKDDTKATSAPRPVNGVVFCPDPADPAAYKDLFPN